MPGVALRVESTSVDAPILVIAGNAVLGIGVTLGTLAVGVFGPRRRLAARFITIPILGMGARLLPRSATDPCAETSLLWATLVLGNIAALLRVASVLLGSSGSGLDTLLGLAGAAGMFAVGAFAWTSRPR